MEIFGACERGDISQLRRWGRQGVRVMRADFLIDAIFAKVSSDILRCLVKELGADVNGARLSDGVTPMFVAAQTRNLALVRCLVKEHGADVNQGNKDGGTPFYMAAQKGYLELVRCLVKDLGADVNQAANDGATPLCIAVQEGHLAVVRCMVKELGADVNRGRPDGVTPLMIAARFQHDAVVAFLIKYGANVQAAAPSFGTAAEVSRRYGAPAQQTQFLEDRSHCARLGCDGEGKKKCAGCLKVYYCTRECQLAHWPAHKAECRRSANKTASKHT
jgi:ankyrin repeat protein